MWFWLLLPPASPIHTNVWQHLDLMPLEHLQNILDASLKWLHSSSCGEKSRDRFLRMTGIPPAAGAQPIPVPFGHPERGPESLLAAEEKELLHKAQSEVQKLFSHRNLKQLKFSTQKTPWVQQLLPPLPLQRDLFKWVWIISFYRKLVQCWGWWQEMNSGTGPCPPPGHLCSWWDLLGPLRAHKPLGMLQMMPWVLDFTFFRISA